MDTFDEWVKTAQFPCIQKWGDKVVALGASWDSFRRDDKGQITKDLVDGGIPILAARDIVDIATSEAQKSTAPMAVFWDLENMPIPADFSGRDITSVLKNILTPHGDLIQFRGYASIGLNLIPQEKRSDLQLSGCHLVDCPHHGRKEVADKMIIVDAMHFAYQHPDGATLCFITGDVDYAYLLAMLQQRPQYRTIVISRGTMQSMLHVNCHMKMRWETDILQKISYNSRQEEVSKDDDDLDQDDMDNSVDGIRNQLDQRQEQFTPLTADEFWKDDIELLRNIMVHEGRRSGTRTPHKYQVGNLLRQTNPARFPNRESVKVFFAQTIEKKIIAETGDKLTLIDQRVFYNQSDWLPVSVTSPLPIDEIPAKALEMTSKTLPFILFVRKNHCPPGCSPPERTYVQATEFWLLLLYPSYEVVKNALSSNDWLRQGTLVDFRKVVWRNENVLCSMCGAQCVDRRNATNGKLFCSPECVNWSAYDKSKKMEAVSCTVETLKFLASNDDLWLPRNRLAKTVLSRHEEACSNNKIYARLWVKEAIRNGKVIEIKRPDSRTKIVCLPEYLSQASEAIQPADLSTIDKENFVQNLLWQEDNLGALDRRLVAKKLESSFSDMNTPSRRNSVLLNAQAGGKLYLHKTAFLHIVALTKEQAEASLELQKKQVCDDTSQPAAERTLLSADNAAEDKDSTRSSENGRDCSDVRSVNSVDTASSSEVDLNALVMKDQSSTSQFPTPPGSNATVEQIEGSIKPKTVSLQTLSLGKGKSQEEASAPLPTVAKGQINPRVDENGNYASKSLHVRGYGDGTTERDLRGLFGQYRDVEVVLKNSGPHSFAFVNMSSKEDAIDARLLMNNRVLKGEGIKINFATK